MRADGSGVLQDGVGFWSVKFLFAEHGMQKECRDLEEKISRRRRAGTQNPKSATNAALRMSFALSCAQLQRSSGCSPVHVIRSSYENSCSSF